MEGKDDRLFEEVFEGASEGIIIISKALKIIDINSAFCEMTDLERKNLVGHSSAKLARKMLSGKNLIKTLSAIKTMALNQSVAPYNIEFNNKVLSFSTSIKKKSKYIISIVHDITEQNRLEKQLKESEETYLGILNSIEEAVYIQSEDGVFIDVNKPAEKFYGYEREELIGKTPEFVSAPGKNNIEEVAEKVKSAFEGTPQRFTFWGKRKNGTIFPKEVSVSPGTYFGQKAVIAVARNITETKAAEDKIRENEALLNSIIENSQNGIYVINDKRQFTFLNKAMSEIVGYSDKEMLHKDFAGFIARDSVDIVKERYYKRQSGQKVPDHYEFNIIRKDGSKRRVEIVSTAIAVNEEHVITVGHLTDITKNKRIVNELQQAKDQYYRLFQNVHDAILVFDPIDETILDCNEQALKLYRFKREEFIGMSLSKISKYPDKGQKKIKETLRNGEIKNFESSQHTKFGKQLNVEISAKTIEYNKQPAILSLNHDITKRKKQEKIQQLLLDISEKSVKDISLREYIAVIHNELKKIIKAENLYVALYDRATDKYSFPYYVDKTDNYEGEEQVDLSQTLTNYIRKTKKGRLITEKTEKQLKLEENIQLIGEPSPVWLGAPLIDSDTEDVIGVLALQDYHDKDAYSHDDLLTLEIISNHIGLFIERVKNFEQLKVAKELAEKSDHLKSAFLANMSHEIRTPMNGIIGFTDLLLAPEFSGKQKKDFIEAIQKSGNRMLNTVNDIIEISKIETGEVQVRNKKFNLNQKIREIILFFVPEAEKKSISLQYKTPLPDEDTTFYSDESKLESIITNLVKNAIKYSDKGEIHFGYEHNNTHLLFYCKDEGIGIPENRKEAVFNRFEQADITDTRAFQGSGLGLAISKSYVEMLDGKIWVESVYGEGSAFYFTLPFTQVPRQASPKEETVSKSANLQATKKLNILIAEDDESSIEYLRIVLKDIAASFTEVYTGTDAIEHCKEHPETDLILMDIQLPVLDGHKATRQIREFNKQVTIVAQTAYALEGDEKKALDSGCDGYIAKPINREHLLKLIAQQLKNS